MSRRGYLFTFLWDFFDWYSKIAKLSSHCVTNKSDFPKKTNRIYPWVKKSNFLDQVWITGLKALTHSLRAKHYYAILIDKRWQQICRAKSCFSSHKIYKVQNKGLSRSQNSTSSRRWAWKLLKAKKQSWPPKITLFLRV